MKNITLILLLCISLLEAKVYKSSQAYFDFGGIKTKQLMMLLNKDEFYKQANNYLENKIDMKKVKKDMSDPESKSKNTQLTEVLIPQWDKALIAFINSVEKYNNPVSAYQGLYIISSFYSKTAKSKEFNMLSKVLYESANGKNLCMSYLNYGEVFERGYHTKVDIQKARNIYQEALKKDKCTGWQVNVLGSKIFRINRELKK